MTEGRFVVTSNAKLNLTLGILCVLIGTLATTTWTLAVWTTKIEMRVQRLEEDKCPCGEYFQRSPPDVNR